MPHPLGVAPGQIVVDRHDVHPAAAQGVQVGRQGGHQGLAFTGFHLGDLALMQHDAADQLHVEVPHLEAAHRGFTHGRECLRQEVIEGLPAFNPFFEPAGQGPHFLIAHRLQGRLERVDPIDGGLHFSQLPLVLATEHLREKTRGHGINNSSL